MADTHTFTGNAPRAVEGPRCPHCGSVNGHCRDSKARDGYRWRARYCADCGKRFETEEHPVLMHPETLETFSDPHRAAEARAQALRVLRATGSAPSSRKAS